MTGQQYDELKKFLLFFTTNFDKVAPTASGNGLIDELTKMEQNAPRRAQASLMMMINDSLEMSAHWPANKVAELDKTLCASHTITLTELRYRHSRQFSKLLKRGKLKSISEYHFLKGILDGLTASLSENEQSTLSRLLTEFEGAISEKNQDNVEY